MEEDDEAAVTSPSSPNCSGPCTQHAVFLTVFPWKQPLPRLAVSIVTAIFAVFCRRSRLFLIIDWLIGSRQ